MKKLPDHVGKDPAINKYDDTIFDIECQPVQSSGSNFLAFRHVIVEPPTKESSPEWSVGSSVGKVQESSAEQSADIHLGLKRSAKVHLADKASSDPPYHNHGYHKE